MYLCFLFLKRLLKILIFNIILGSVLICQGVHSVFASLFQNVVMMFGYALEMRNHNFSIVDMVHGMITLQEWYGIMVDNIQRTD